EGQRRYAESLSAYVRQFLNRMDKPDVDYIKGLSPAIAIEQKVILKTPRSTVGSMTEIHDYLRLLFARAGKTYSPVSGKIVKKDDVKDVLDAIRIMKEGTRVYILAAFKMHRNREPKEELNILMQKGFSRIYVSPYSHTQKENDISKGTTYRMEELVESPETFIEAFKFPDNVYVLIDRIVVKEFDEDDEHRLSDSVSTAFYEGEGDVYVEADLPDDQLPGKLLHFNNRFELDGISFEEPAPNLFSFNNPFGACPVCEGFSMVLGIDDDLVIPNKLLSVYEGAIAPWKGEKLGKWKEDFIRGASKFKFPVHKAVADLSAEQYRILWEGNQYVNGINDFFKEVEQNLYKVQYRVILSRYRGRTTCPECNGHRLRKEALYVKVHGKNIGELSSLPITDLRDWFNAATPKFSEYQQQVAKRIMIEIHHRINTMLDVGLGYLSLNRLANTLSGGESQRIQLTRSLGSNLTNSLYILDEPSIGLHPRDTGNLIRVLKELRDLGNTVVVVEHDEMMMREADHIIDMGPLASHLGGEVIASGNYEQIISNPGSLTGKYLNGTFKIEAPKKLRKWNESIIIEGARHHNLKDITVEFPLQVLTVVCGVSGSGKTTLIKHILYPALRKLQGEAADKIGFHRSIGGTPEAIAQVEMVDQNPIGKSSRSNPVTYIKAWDQMRDLFAAQPLSKMRGFQPKHFSFNVDGGRCDACKGEGEKIVEMQFLADVHLTCEVCQGKKFKEEVLEVQYKGKNVFEVLQMSVDEAIEFFKDEKSVCGCIQPLSEVGLGYVKLGQSSNTLSGGEAQRVKLASFLGKGRSASKILFIFDEPTTGLHFHDIKKLLASFNALINQGHSVLVIEHNTDVIKSADWVIELGPEAGAAGGHLVYAGVPAGMKKVKNSPTAGFLV
ncbi:MAG: excinuclease ABC subunit UvrA, partial [Flavisolibacter sp.]|nr:excinuclease ABC subunit UvrA [Flavisolibacter sp.]